jgi:PEP-utilizing family enzyme
MAASEWITKWGRAERAPVVRFFHERIRALVAARTAALGGEWRTLAAERTLELLRREDFEAIERELLATGHRFDYSATISLAEAPEKYKPRPSAQAGAATAAPEAGRREVGGGDNLIARKENVVGVARFISTTEQVTAMLVDGVPEATIAVIDDSGGTLTAPILEGFTAILCLGGTVRSHLGILAREYGIPCLMNCKLGPELRDGDRVEIEASAPAATAESYESGKAPRARVWKLP